MIAIIDIETDNIKDLISSVSKIHCIVISYGDGTYPYLNLDKFTTQVFSDNKTLKPDGTLSEALELLQQADTIVGHNIISFDLPVINRLLGKVEPKQVLDTLILSKLLIPKQELYDIDTNTGPLKGRYSIKAFGKRFNFDKLDYKEFDKITPEIIPYCIRDVDICKCILTWLATTYKDRWIDQVVEIEHKVAEIIAIQEENGFSFDIKGAKKLRLQLLNEKMSIETEIQAIFKPIFVPKGKVVVPKNSRRVRLPDGRYARVMGDYQNIELKKLNIGSRKQVLDRLKLKYDFNPTNYTMTGNPKLEFMLKKDGSELDNMLAKIKRYLKIQKDLSQLADGENSLINCYNEQTKKLHCRIDTLGTTTHRMTHSNPNITQVPKDPGFRKLLTASEGKVLIDVDASALEAMTLGHYMCKYDDGRFIETTANGDKDKGTDIHTLNQVAMGLPTRDMAKTVLYAIMYGSGATKVGSTVWDRQPFEYTQEEYDLARDRVYSRAVRENGKLLFPISSDTLTPVTEELVLATIYGIRTLESFRDNIKGYNELNRWTRDSITNNTIKALDGRTLYIVDAHKSLNVYLQSAGAIFMKYVLVELDKELKTTYKDYDIRFVANIHDAITLEMKDGEIVKSVCDSIRNIFTKVSNDFGFKYPIEGEPKVGLNQYEVH